MGESIFIMGWRLTISMHLVKLARILENLTNKPR